MRLERRRWAKPIRLPNGIAERGATAVEYSLILVGIMAVIITVVAAVGQMVLGLFTAAASAFP
jgi:Flp pilus assembly pilin Flp